MKKNKFKAILGAVLLTTLGSISFNGCKEVDNPPNPNEEELITSVVLQFTDTSSNQTSTFKFADPDGAGGNPPSQFDTIRLDSHAVYLVSVQFLDESGNLTVDITKEVKEEAEDHLVCYDWNGLGNIQVTDQDVNGLDLGLEAEFITKSPESGNLVISLKHQPEIKDGSCNLGETDVEVSFHLEVE